MSAVSGVLLRSSAGLVVVPEADVIAIARIHAVTPVEGLVAPALGLAQVDREVAVVISLDDDAREPRIPPAGLPAVVCSLGAERVAVVGAEVECVGTFERDESGALRYGVAAVAELDVRALYGRAEALAFAQRASRAGKPDAPAPTPAPTSWRPR